MLDISHIITVNNYHYCWIFGIFIRSVKKVYLSKLSFSLEICGILGTSTANAIPTRAMK